RLQVARALHLQERANVDDVAPAGAHHAGGDQAGARPQGQGCRARGHAGPPVEEAYRHAIAFAVRGAIDEEGEHLVVTEHAQDLARAGIVGDGPQAREAPRLLHQRVPARRVENLRDHVDGIAAPGQDRAAEVRVAQVAAHEDEPVAARERLLDMLDAIHAQAALDLLHLPAVEPHHVHEVLAVIAERPPRETSSLAWGAPGPDDAGR